MKRLLTALVILLVVLVAGMTALVLLVNPNDFRAVIVKKVVQQSGYQLNLTGDMRWHVWPTLSILIGPSSLTAPGASTALVNAENMRLDVELWPLLSHRLAIKKVVLKGAVFRFTADSEGQAQPNAPIAPASDGAIEGHTQWQFNISRLQVIDSMLVWQRADNQQINLRDVNFSLQQDEHHQARLVFASRVNRDQRDLSLSLSADIDLQRYPDHIAANIDEFNYRLEGATILPSGISGQGSMRVVYQQRPDSLLLDNVQLSANNNQIAGRVAIVLGDVPDYQVSLNSSRLNLDELSGWQPTTGVAIDSGEPLSTTPVAPVIASPQLLRNQYMSRLKESRLQLDLRADSALYRGVNLNKLVLKAGNQRGLFSLRTLSAELLDGNIDVAGVLDLRGERSQLTIQPRINHVQLAPLLAVFALPNVLSGQLSSQGTWCTDDIDTINQLASWRGEGEVQLRNAQLQGLNIQHLIQRAVIRTYHQIQSDESDNRNTELSQFETKVTLQKGKLTLDTLQAHSPSLQLQGSGSLDFVGRQVDMNVGAEVIQGWYTTPELTAILQRSIIPLRIYGPWEQLSYRLDVEKLLRGQMEQEAKKALGDWLGSAERPSASDMRKQVDKALKSVKP